MDHDDQTACVLRINYDLKCAPMHISFMCLPTGALFLSIYPFYVPLVVMQYVMTSMFDCCEIQDVVNVQSTTKNVPKVQTGECLAMPNCR
jgi:hypothetical protein